MNINDIWESFLIALHSNKEICTATYKKYAGIPFLMVETADTECPLLRISETIKHASALAMRGKRLHSETFFVRKEEALFVFRHRFYVPQEKMFCCGNLCVDCIRFR